MSAVIKEQHERTLHRTLTAPEVQTALLRYVAAENGVDLDHPDITGKVYIHRGPENYGEASVTLTQNLSEQPKEQLGRLLNLALSRMKDKGSITIEHGSQLHRLMEECAGMAGKKGGNDDPPEES